MTTSTATNRYCSVLAIQVPTLESARWAADANFYSLLIVALLERGEPITLAQAATRFAEAGIAPAADALASLKRCKPGRPPLHRDGDHYALDPHDQEADLWVFRLGLKPPARPRPVPIQLQPALIRAPEESLRVPELDEAWRGDVPSGWSALRVAIGVLDAHDAPMRPADVVAFVAARSRWSPLQTSSSQYWRRGSPVRVRDDGFWELDRAHPATLAARREARARAQLVRRWASQRPDHATIEAHIQDAERRRAQHAERLAGMTRVIVVGFPKRLPGAVTLLDVEQRRIQTIIGSELVAARDSLRRFDIVIGLEIRPLISALGFDSEERWLVELSPPQKTLTLNRRGRTLGITTEMLIQGSCGLGRPLGEPDRMQRYLDSGDDSKLRRRLEANAKALLAYYEYGRLHHGVRLQWGFLDTMFAVSWAHRDEASLGSLMRQAHTADRPLEVVVGRAPGWEDPWARGEPARVVKQADDWRLWLIGGDGQAIQLEDVQRARLG